jgi:hypothetical protein
VYTVDAQPLDGATPDHVTVDGTVIRLVASDAGRALLSAPNRALYYIRIEMIQRVFARAFFGERHGKAAAKTPWFPSIEPRHGRRPPTTSSDLRYGTHGDRNAV